MNKSNVFLSKIHLTYFLILIISIGSALGFIRMSLEYNASVSLQQFLQSNKDEIASASSMELATKLNALMASENIVCVSGKIKNNYFINFSKGLCKSPLFISEVAYKSPYNNDLQINISYSLSNYLLISTFSFIFGEILLFVYLLKISKEKLSLEIKSKKAIFSLSQKLAHDIRSPISTLNLISSKIENEDIKSLQLAVVNQINAIANDLLNESKDNNIQNVSLVTNNNLEKMLRNLEKEYQFKANAIKQKIIFTINYALASKRNFDPKLTSIIYSSINNFIQNSIEATDDNGIINISVDTNQNGLFEISVSDNGKGIPTDILNRLGQEILSHGKSYNSSNSLQSGNGIALYNAKKELSEYKIDLKIESELNQGTKIKIVTS